MMIYLVIERWVEDSWNGEYCYCEGECDGHKDYEAAEWRDKYCSTMNYVDIEEVEVGLNDNN